MKQLIFILAFITGTNTIISQEDCKYEYYNYYTSKAQIQYGEEKFSEARKNIEHGLSKTDFPFGQDLRTALKIGEAIKDTQYLYEISIELAKGGIPLEYFEKYTDYGWFNTFTNHFPDYVSFYKENFDHVLIQKILDLRHQDSTFNAHYHKYKGDANKLTLEDLITGATSIRDNFVNIVKEHGFPNKQNMGYYYAKKDINKYPIVIILIHIFQRGDQALKKHLSQIVCDGKLKPIEHTVLNGFRGFLKGQGIENEMKHRYERYWNKKNN